MNIEQISKDIQEHINDDTLTLSFIQDKIRITPDEASKELSNILRLPKELSEYPVFNLASCLLPLSIGIGTMLGRYTYLLIPNVNKKMKANLMGMVVGGPGAGKTIFSQKLLTNHLKRFDSRLQEPFKKMREKIYIYDKAELIHVSRKDFEKFQYLKLSGEKISDELHIEMNNIIKGSHYDKKDALNLIIEKGIFNDPPLNRLNDLKTCYISNITAARLMSVTVNNPVCCVYDDVSEFKRVFGVESKNSETNFTSVLLSLYSDYAIKIDRQGEDNDFSSNDCFLSCWINAQPSLLDFMLEKNFMGSGLTWRFSPIILEYEEDDFVDLENFELKKYPDMPFLTLLYDRVFNSFYNNKELNSDNQCEFSYNKKAEEKQLILNKHLEFIGQVLEKKLKKVKRAEMISKLREMIDKYSFIFQVIQDNIGDGLYDQGVSASNNRMITPECLEAGWIYSRMIFDQWIRLHAISAVKDVESDEMKSDTSKEKKRGDSHINSLVAHLNGPGEFEYHFLMEQLNILYPDRKDKNKKAKTVLALTLRQDRCVPIINDKGVVVKYKIS